MFGHATYLIWLALFIAAPIILLIVWKANIIWKQRRAIIWTMLGAFVGGWIWDLSAVSFGAWYFDPLTIVNVWLGGLPLEEWLWILGVTVLFSIVTVVMKERAS